MAYLIILAVLNGDVMAGEFYWRSGLGYAFVLNGLTMNGAQPYDGKMTKYTQRTTYAYTYRVDSEILINRPASFSAGLQGVLGFGYTFNKNVGIQVDASLGIINQQYTYEEYDNMEPYADDQRSTRVLQADHTLIAIPVLVLQTAGERWNFYCRAGIALPCRTVIKESYETKIDDVTKWSGKMKSSFSIGYSGALGFKCGLNKNADMWVEANIMWMNLYIMEADYYNIETHPDPNVGSVTTPPPVVNYSKYGMNSFGGAERATYVQPFSNVGLHMGITWRLDKKNKPAEQNEVLTPKTD
jgi:hypothetical protein